LLGGFGIEVGILDWAFSSEYYEKYRAKKLFIQKKWNNC
jgi:hypothetical protein